MMQSKIKRKFANSILTLIFWTFINSNSSAMNNPQQFNKLLEYWKFGIRNMPTLKVEWKLQTKCCWYIVYFARWCLSKGKDWPIIWCGMIISFHTCIEFNIIDIYDIVYVIILVVCGIFFIPVRLAHWPEPCLGHRGVRVLLYGMPSNLYVVYKFKAFYTSLSRLHSTFTWQIVPVSMHSICGPYGVWRCVCVCAANWTSMMQQLFIFSYFLLWLLLPPPLLLLPCFSVPLHSIWMTTTAATAAETAVRCCCCVLMNLTGLIPPAHNLFIAFPFIFFYM